MWLFQTLISFLSQAIVAAYFGTGANLDAYLVGTTIPTTIYMIVSTGLGAAAIVYFNQVKARAGKSEACEKIGGVAVAASMISVLMAIFIFGAADELIELFTPGLSSEVHQKAVACLRITAPSLPFIVLLCLLTGLLQAEGHFYITSLASILFVGLVPLPVLISEQISSESLALGFDLSATGSCLFLLGTSISKQLITNGRVQWVEWKYLVALSAPAFTAACFTHGMWLVERYLASSLHPGAISALNYGQRIINFLAGGLTFVTATTLLPHLSLWLESGEKGAAAAFNRRAMLLTTIFAIAGTLSLAVGGEWLVRLAFARGEFDEAAVGLTTTAMYLYIGVFVGYLFSVVLGRNALAVNEGKMMVASSSTLFIAYLAVAPVLQKTLSFQGLALAASVAWVLSFSVYFYGMHRKYPFLYVQEARNSLNTRVSKA